MHIFDVDAKVLHNNQPALFDSPWHVSGSKMWSWQLGHAKSSVLFLPSFTSQALLYAAKGHRHTHTSFKNECTLSCTFCAQKLKDAALCLIGQICDSSPLCRHYSEHTADNICPSWSLVTNVGWHKHDQPYITHNTTMCVVRLFYNKHYIFVVVHITKWAKHSNNGPLLQENVQMFQKMFAGDDAILLLVQSSCIAEKSFIEWGSLIFGGEILLALSK